MVGGPYAATMLALIGAMNAATGDALEDALVESELLVAEPDICEVGSKSGYVFPLFGDDEAGWPKALRAILYLMGTLWCFLGVAIVADLFMAAIEEITSKIYLHTDKTGKKRVHRFWNPTVANLSLMALGSSAPEIMLNVVEVVGLDFHVGPLGTSTIVGSAAFNLFVITAVLVAAITDGTKKVETMQACFLQPTPHPHPQPPLLTPTPALPNTTRLQPRPSTANRCTYSLHPSPSSRTSGCSSWWSFRRLVSSHSQRRS